MLSCDAVTLQTVMVVEDDVELLDVLRQLFSGFRVLCVDTLAEAHAVLARARIDVLVLDFRLPDGTAEQLLGALAGRSDAPAVVLVSGDEGAARCAARYGIELVRKPFDTAALLAIVERAYKVAAKPREA